MKNFAFLLLILLFFENCFSQNESEKTVWKLNLKDSALFDFNKSNIIETEAKILQIIPIDKTNQSYVFVFGILENTDQSFIDKNNEEIKISSKTYKVIECEVSNDNGGKKLLEYLGCNTDFNVLENDKTSIENYYGMQNQPCIGMYVKIKTIIQKSESKNIYYLLEVNKS